MRRSLLPLAILAVAATSLLTGCSEDPSTTVTGAVVKGITANALITARAPDGTLLATALSDAQGGYSLTLPPGYSGAVRLTGEISSAPDPATISRCDALSGCGNFAEASAYDVNGNLTIDFGEWSLTPAEFSLRAVTVANAGVLQAVNLSPVSSMAADWANEFPQGLDAVSAQAANERAAAIFGTSPADLLLPAGDITDPLWLNIADAQQIKAALVSATFAEVAARFGVSQQYVIDAVTTSFVSQDGRLLQADTGTSINQALLLGITRELAAGLAIPVVVRAQVLAEIDAQTAVLVVGELSGHPEVTVDELLAKLGPLGVQLQELRVLTGLDDFDSFLNEQEPFFSWIWSDDNLKIVPLGTEVVLFSALSSLMLDNMSAGDEPLTLLSDNCGFTLVLDPAAKTVRWHGRRFGQMVDLTVSLTAFRGGLESNQFEFGIVGTLSNPTASGDIDGTVLVDFGSTDLEPMITALFEGDNALLKQALYDLAYSLEATVTLDGEASLVRTGDFDPPQVLGGQVSLVGSVDLGALDGETIATLLVSTADLMLPNGTHLYGVVGMPVLDINVANDATAIVHGAGDILGLPTAYLHAEGTLVNARSIFDHIRNTLAAVLVQPDPAVNIPQLVVDLLDFDFSQLSATGEAVATIPDLGHEYRATLDDLTVSVYQPHSTEVAMTATLDVDGMAIHYMLGDEPWVQRLETTPQLRMTLLGPEGQFAEITQQDVMDFLSPVLDTLLDTDLFAGVGVVLGSDCGVTGGGGGGGGTDAPAIGLVQNGTVIDKLIVGSAGLHVNFTGVLPKSTESYFARWFIDGIHVPSLDGLTAGEIPVAQLLVGSHTIRAEFTDLTALLPTIVRVSQTLLVAPQPVVIAPDTSILAGVSISIKQNGVEVRRAPEGADNIEVTLVGFNPPEGSDYTLRWYLDGVHYPAYNNQLYASSLVNPLIKGAHTLRLEITDNNAPTLSVVRMAEMVVVTPGEPAGAAGFAMLGMLALLLWRRRALSGA